MYDIFSLKDFKMPENFLWGSGYAGHQVEGNNTNNQWWLDEEEGRLPEKSGLACNSYEMFETDVALVEKLGHKSFRTSVEWCRIEPEEGIFNEEAVNHYIKFFASLKEKGIKVFATMVHFTVPLWFYKKGHFENAENVKYFERYLEYIVPKIAPYVDFWNVINEFNLQKPEFKLNSLLFHARGYHVIKKYSKGPVSSAHALVQPYPYRPFDRWDKAMCEISDLKDNEFFFHAIRTGEIDFPEHDAVFNSEVKDTVDFWSINTYVRAMIDSRVHNLKGKVYEHKHLKMIDCDFYLEEIYPEGVIASLGRCQDKPIYITENGCSCDDDRFRIVYMALFLSAISEAIKMGCDVRGYSCWSLLDNYEWGSYKPKFGLCSCDPNTFERIEKPSAYFYKDIIENNGLNQEIIRKHLKEFPSLGL